MLKRVFYCLIGLVFFTSGYAVSQTDSFTEFAFKRINSDRFYYGRYQDSLVYIKFDKVEKEYASGYFFVADKSVFAEQHNFTIEKKRNKYFLRIEGKTYKIKSELKISDKGIVGKCRVKEKGSGLFNFGYWTKPLLFKLKAEEDSPTYAKRYKQQIYEVDIKNDVKYGTAKGYWASYPVENESYFEIIENGVLSTVVKKNLDLTMDIYTPRGDSLKERPLIMFIHGGGFYIGDKKTEAMVEWCKYFASMGYVTASINYRIGYKVAGPSVERAGYRALQDAHAAMRFLVKNSEKYGINPELLFVGGSSAGGITALNLTFMRNNNRPESSRKSLLLPDLGNVESSTNSINQKFEIDAVINMWGAVDNLDILKNSKASIISFHGDADKVVPIDYDYPFQDIKMNINALILSKMYGSLPIHIKAKRLGNREELHIFESAGHSPHVDVDDKLNGNFDFISEKVRDFLYLEIFETPCQIVSKPITPIKRAMPYYETTCTDYKEINWSIEGGIITGTKENAVRVIWFDNSGKHKLILSGCYGDGTGFYDTYEF